MPSSLLPVDVLDLHLGVLAGTWTDGAFDSAAPVIYGTAFPIAPGLLATAAHVLRDASADGTLAICRVVKTELGHDIRVYGVQAFERVEAIDLGLLSCPSMSSETVTLPVSFEPLRLFDEVTAVGYPYAVDGARLSLVHRGFRGHIVTRRELTHVAGQPPGYELSFRAPRGLSGAPVVAHDAEGGAFCHGYVIEDMNIGGNEPGALHAGIAVATDALLSVNSQILGGPLARLFGRDFVPRRPGTPIRNPHMAAPAIDDDWPPDSDPAA